MEYSDPRLIHYLALDAFPKFGPIRLSKLGQAFPSPEHALKATLQELIIAGLEPKIAEEFLVFRQGLSGEKILETLQKNGICVVCVFEDAYPERLKTIPNPPFILYYKGFLKAAPHPLAVVGSRNFSHYGEETVKKITSELAQAGLTIVSGLALGIDALAHQATLAVGGLTWAVLGTGLDQQNLYPAVNKKLAEEIIAQGGCLFSELRPATKPMPYHFPMRNRIIAGLSFGTLVIEASLKSGSLITADYARQYQRECFAVPGAINNPLSIGTNELLKQGARPVTASKDILDILDLKVLTSYSYMDSYVPQNADEAHLLSFLSNEAKHIDELARLSNQPIQSLHSQIAILEINGAVKNIGNMHYLKL